MTTKTFNDTLALALLDSEEEFPVDFDRAWKWIGYGKKVDAKNFLVKNFELGIDYTMLQPELGTLAVPRPKEEIRLTLEAFKMWGMMAGTEQGKQIRKYFLQCEKLVKQRAHDRSLYDELAELKKSVAKLEAASRTLPPASVDPIPEPIAAQTERAMCNRLVRGFAHNQTSSQPLSEQDIWRWMYRELKYRYNYDAYARVKKTGNRKLYQIEVDGQMSNLLAVCHHFLSPHLHLVKA